MKKAIYLLAATAFLASCNQEVLIDTPDVEPTTPRAIGFKTFADKATRADANNSKDLNDFYPTFNVYGWKTVGSEVTCVFNNIPVEYFTEDKQGTVVYKEANQKPTTEWATFATGWYYQDIRYWDKMASNYQYSAYVPASATDAVNCASDGLITIGTATAPVTVDDKNLMATPAEALAYKGFDLDYMTAQATATPSTNPAAMSTPVSLIFKHLQAKLNIRIKLDESVKTAQDIKVTDIRVHNLNDKGYYTNAKDEEGNEVGVSGWTVGTATADYVPCVTTDYLINNADEEEGIVSYHNHYVLEQLIIPQTITKYTASTTKTTADGEEGGEDENTENGENTEEPENGNTNTPTEEPTPAVVTLPVSLTEYDEACVYVEYTIGAETFKSYTPLANIFTTAPIYNFEGGKQYTLNITIGPKPINFTAEVTYWAEAIQGNHNIN